MSKQHFHLHFPLPKTAAWQIAYGISVGLLVPALLVFLVGQLLLGLQATHVENTAATVKIAHSEAHITPVATVSLAAPARAAHADQTGEQVVKAVCIACHGTGALGSPKIGDKSAWAPRIKQGYETLIKHAVEGIRQMPARGGNPALSDGEIANAVAYMANQSGAKFSPPAPKP